MATKTVSRPVNKAQKAAQAQGRQAQPSSSQRPAARPPSKPNLPAPRVARSSAIAEANLSQMPAFMRNDAGMGKEAIGMEDLERPRLKLIQGLSPELQEHDGLRAGHFFHTAAEHIFDTSFRATPIFMDRQYILWNPRESGGGILARASDGIHWQPPNAQFDVKLDRKDGGAQVSWRTANTVSESGLAEWGTMNPDDPNSPPAATLMYNFLLAFTDFPDLMPAVLTFQRSSIKMGRRLNTKLKTVQTPIFGLVFEFKSFEDNNSTGQSFFNVQASGAGVVEDEALYNYYRDIHMALRDTGLQVRDVETLNEDDSSVAAANAADAEMAERREQHGRTRF